MALSSAEGAPEGMTDRVSGPRFDPVEEREGWFSDRANNSLFRDLNSLFGRNISLFRWVGNLAKEPRYISPLEDLIRPITGQFCKNSLFFPCLTGNFDGDRFAADCLHRHI
jgi:hypothetical protein